MTHEQHSLTVAMDQTTVQTWEESQRCRMIAWTSQTSLFISAGKQLIPPPRGASFRISTKNYADDHMALILWWRCNYINYIMTCVIGGSTSWYINLNRAHACAAIDIVTEHLWIVLLGPTSSTAHRFLYISLTVGEHHGPRVLTFGQRWSSLRRVSRREFPSYQLQAGNSP